MKVIAIEEHWNSISVRDALDGLPDGTRDESTAFNARGGNRARPGDAGRDQTAGSTTRRLCGRACKHAQ